MGLSIVLTAHALQRARDRNVSLELIQDIVDSGIQIEAKPGHFWFYKHMADRTDNLLCAAVVIKTGMHHWSPAP